MCALNIYAKNNIWFRRYCNAEEEGIVYRLEHTELQEEGKIDLTERGELMCFKNKTAFRIYVEPETKGSYRAAIIIDVYVRN